MAIILTKPEEKSETLDRVKIINIVIDVQNNKILVNARKGYEKDGKFIPKEIVTESGNGMPTPITITGGDYELIVTAKPTKETFYEAIKYKIYKHLIDKEIVKGTMED